jgi:hypothetical protein
MYLDPQDNIVVQRVRVFVPCKQNIGILEKLVT